MFSRRILLAATLLAAAPAFPQAPATDANAEARAIIADLQRIVTPQGVQELYKARIGGLDQWVSVRGKDRDNPVLLFVHGGPASPAMPVSWTFQRGWEDYFTVVHWDQRGAGKTLLANDPGAVAPTLVLDRYVDDTIELIGHLRERFGKRKVVLVGHSWGSVVGLKAALRKPAWVHAYVGIGQVISFADNERMSYAHAVASAREDGNQAALDELATIAPYPGEAPLTRDRIIIARKWAQHYGGLSAYRSDSGYYFKAPRLSPEYDAADRAAINAGSLLTLDRVMQEWMSLDLKPVTRIEVPVFMFMGRHDYSTPSAQAEQWLARVEAPAKAGIWFEHSSHLAPLEEPGRVLVELVQRVRPLAGDD